MHEFAVCKLNEVIYGLLNNYTLIYLSMSVHSNLKKIIYIINSKFIDISNLSLGGARN